MLMALLETPVNAEDIGLTARVDNNEISLGDTLHLSLTVKGVLNAPEPNLPPLSDFRIRSSSTASSTQIINGQRTVSVTYNYQLVPLKAGSFTIDPAILELAGVTYQSNPVLIVVSEPGAHSPAKKSPAYIEAFVSNANPYVNEQLIYTFRLYRRVQARNLDLSISFEDGIFRKEDMGDAKIFSRTINGIQYQIHELTTALYPIRSGDVEISPATLEIDLLAKSPNSPRQSPFPQIFDNRFFGSRANWLHKTLRSQPLAVSIRPLPKAGKPVKFSNIVGDLDISATIGKKELKAGDTTTLTVTLNGSGALKGYLLPLPKLSDGFKIYPDKPEFKLSVQQNTLMGEKIFKFALVPLKPGHKILPSITLSYFDPARNKYLIKKTTPISLTIEPAEFPENLNSAENFKPKKSNTKNSIETTGEDILPIHTRLSDFEEVSANGSDVILLTGRLVAPPVLFLLFTVYIRFNQKLKHDKAFARNRKAFKIARQKLKKLSSSSGPPPRDFAKKLSDIFREYVGNKLNIQGKALTSFEVEQKLIDQDYPKEQAEQTRVLWGKYESLQYAPTTDSKNNLDMIDESLRLLNQLEKKS